MPERFESTTIMAGSHENWRSLLPPAKESWPQSVKIAHQQISTNQSLTIQQGLDLFDEPNLHAIGELAHDIKTARFGQMVFFNANVHINQTNICTLACRFCAFRRGRRAEDAYALTIENYLEELDKYAESVDEVHSVGALHPDWNVGYYVELFRSVKHRYPNIHIKALTAVEVKHIAKLSKLDVRSVLNKLKEAGLGSLPGGGAEILDDEVRENICKGKETTSEYLEIHRMAHELEIPTNCTMLFGTIESSLHRVKHLFHLRDLQTQTKGFQCFVPYPFLPDDSRLPDAQLATGSEILRTIAISRIILDNIPHIKAYRMNIGDSLSELALQYGADDVDGIVQQEQIMHLAGSNTNLQSSLGDLAKIVVNAGGIPVRRNSTYTRFELFDAESLESRNLPRVRTLKVIQ